MFKHHCIFVPFTFLALCLLTAGCLDLEIEEGKIDPKLAYRNIIQNPMPNSVKELQGTGGSWQGYVCWLRFKADDPAINAIIAQGYQRMNWQDIALDMDIDPEYDASVFTPDWKPSAINQKECYQLDNVQNPWTHSGTNVLVIDRTTGTVYVWSFGA